MWLEVLDAEAAVIGGGPSDALGFLVQGFDDCDCHNQLSPPDIILTSGTGTGWTISIMRATCTFTPSQ